jgi:rare lipoprotein A
VVPIRSTSDSSSIQHCGEHANRSILAEAVTLSVGRFLNGVIHSMKALILATAALAAVIGSARAESGIASHYSTRELGTKTASGRALHDGTLTAAHKTLPFGSRVRVTNHTNGRSVVVTITDRGPYVRGRVIDVSTAGARVLGFSGLTRVSVEKVETGS